MDSWLETKKLPAHFIAVSGLVCKGDKVLLIKSERRGWEFPGGVIEQGEAILDGLKREIFEETGITARPVSFVGIYQNLSAKKGYGPLEGMELPPVVNLSFICEYISGKERVSDESIDVGWFNKDEAKNMVQFPSYGKRLLDMLNFNGAQHFCTFEKKDIEAKFLSDTIL